MKLKGYWNVQQFFKFSSQRVNRQHNLYRGRELHVSMKICKLGFEIWKGASFREGHIEIADEWQSTLNDLDFCLKDNQIHIIWVQWATIKLKSLKHPLQPKYNWNKQITNVVPRRARHWFSCSVNCKELTAQQVAFLLEYTLCKFLIRIHLENRTDCIVSTNLVLIHLHA